MKGLKGWFFAVVAAAGAFFSATQSYAGETPQVTVAAAVTECSMDKELYFSGMQLANLVSLNASCFQKFGGLSDERVYDTAEGPYTGGGYYTGSGFYLFSNDGSTATVEFHGINAYGSYGGIGNGFLLQLTQEGDDIYGQIMWHAGSTQMSQYLTDSWAFKAGGGAYDKESLYATYCSNLTAVFNDLSGTCVVSFVGFNGAELLSIEVDAGTSISSESYPVPIEVEGYVFVGWSQESVFVTGDTVVTALYAKEHTVVFKDADGTELSTQIVVDGMAAVAPDMTGKTYDGDGFIGWSEPFSAVTSDMVIIAQYGDVPEEVLAAIASGLASGGDLIWGGGDAGLWNETDLNWYSCSLSRTAWVAGANAVFPKTANIEVVDTVSCSNIVIGATGNTADVKFTGGIISLVAGATVTLNGQTVEFGGELSSLGDVSLLCNVVNGSVVDYTQPLTFDETLLFPGAKLADISDLKIYMKGKFGSSTPDLVLTTEPDMNGNGIHFYTVTDTQITGQAKIKTYHSYGGVWETIKFVLTERAEGIYGVVEYVSGGTGDGGWLPELDLDQVEGSLPNNDANSLVTAPIDDSDTWGSAPTYSAAIYRISYKNANSAAEIPEYKVSGVFNPGGVVTLGLNTVLRSVDTGLFGAGGTLSKEFKGFGSLAFDSAATQRCTGRLNLMGLILVDENAHDVMFEGNKGDCMYVDIAGTLTIKGDNSLPIGNGRTKVLPDGKLVMNSISSIYYGLNGNAPINVYTNAELQLTENYNIGRRKPIYLIGGAITEGGDTARTQLTHMLYMSDGATYAGSEARMGDYNSGTWSYIEVGGQTPSSFSATSLLLNSNNANGAGETKIIGGKFDVADVTGDAATDFTLNSVIGEVGETFYSEGWREHCGFWKTGAGTMELTAAGSCATSGVFKIDAGTLRLASGSSGEYGALKLEGNSSIDCAGGTIAFDASADFAWTEGAVLNITGTLGSRSIRFGSNSNALTEEQLDAISYNGGKASFTLNNDGYLRNASSMGFKLIIK